MQRGVDDEWYWLREIYRLMSQTNVLLDWVVPIATTVTALAAIYLGYRSYKAARQANDQSLAFRREDRAEADLRWRRTFAVDLREWYRDAKARAFYDIADDDESREQRRRLHRKIDKAGQDTAKRLFRFLQTELDAQRTRMRGMTGKERARQRHPSRYYSDDQEGLIADWVKAPPSVLSTFDASEAAAESARLQDLSELRAKLDAAAPAAAPPPSE